MLESIFETICQQFSNFSPSNFRFIEGVTPLSTVQAVVLSLVCYIGLIFLLRSFIKNQNKPATEKKPILRTIFIFHNILLTVFSLILLILLLDNILPKLYHHGLFWCICDEKMFDGQLEFFLLFELPSPILWASCHNPAYLVGKAIGISSCISSFFDISTLLYSACWKNFRAMGSHHFKFICTCDHVLLLRTCCFRTSSLVEEIPYNFANCSICHWSFLCLLLHLHPFCIPVWGGSSFWGLFWWRICCDLWLLFTFFLLASFCRFLHENIPQAKDNCRQAKDHLIKF